MNSLGGNIIINLNNICSLIGMMFGEYPTFYISIKIVGCVLTTIWYYYFIPKNQLLYALTWNFINIGIAIIALCKPYICSKGIIDKYRNMYLPDIPSPKLPTEEIDTNTQKDTNEKS